MDLSVLIGTFRFSQNVFSNSNMAESLRLGSDDVKRLLKLGVAEFQIDSVYEPAFR